MELSKIKEILKKELPLTNIKFEEPMNLHTSFKIGGIADVFITANNIEEVKKILDISKENNIPLKVIGNGTNLLVKDKGYRGIILKINLQNIEINKNDDKNFNEKNEIITKNTNEEEVNEIFIKAINGETLTQDEIEKYATLTMTNLGRIYHKHSMVMQLHIGALRNNNTRMFKKLGPDVGFDSIDDGEVAQPLSKLLDTLDGEDKLPKTILYCLNPKDNEVLGTMLGNFQGGGIAGKIQFGSGWWFNDQKDGMERQMMALSQLGLLSQFVGMLTDSRSFLSYTRHEYFRRILCNYIGGLVENGEYPADMDILGEIIENICYNNAVRYCKGQ